jgi:hypothetical protein
MTDRNESLIALAERCEKATGPDRELDAEIAVAIEYELPNPMGECRAHLRVPHLSDECEAGTYWLVQRSGMSLQTAPRYTASLDAAIELVPEGWDWLVRNDVEERGSFANVSRPNKQHIIDTWDEERRCFYAGNTDGCNYAQAATPALALTAAALRARAAQ